MERVGQFLEEKGFEKEVIEKFAGKLPLRSSTKCQSSWQHDKLCSLVEFLVFILLQEQKVKGRHLSIMKKSQDKSVLQAFGLTTVGEQMEFISHIESLENFQGTTLHFSFSFVPFLCV